MGYVRVAGDSIARQDEIEFNGVPLIFDEQCNPVAIDVPLGDGVLLAFPRAHRSGDIGAALLEHQERRAGLPFRTGYFEIARPFARDVRISYGDKRERAEQQNA